VQTRVATGKDPAAEGVGSGDGYGDEPQTRIAGQAHNGCGGVGLAVARVGYKAACG